MKKSKITWDYIITKLVWLGLDTDRLKEELDFNYKISNKYKLSNDRSISIAMLEDEYDESAEAWDYWYSIFQQRMLDKKINLKKGIKNEYKKLVRLV